MRVRRLILAAVLSWALSPALVSAEPADAPPHAAAGQPAAPAPRGADGASGQASGSAVGKPTELKTVVVGLAARRGVDAGLALAMSDVVQGVYAQQPGRTALGRSDIERVLSFESERAALGCDTTSCLSEIAQALDVDRLLTGSMDKVGSSYFVVITEIDARTVAPVGRVQAQLPLDEDHLVPGITGMARKLLTQAGPLRGAPGPGQIPTGRIVVQAKPGGARVQVSGRDVGVSPVSVDGLPPGEHDVSLLQEGYAPVRLQVPVFAGGTTELTGQLGAPPTPNAEALRLYDESLGWHRGFAWSKIGTASACALLAPVSGLMAGGIAVGAGVSDAPFEGVCSLCTGVQLIAALSLCGWGAADLFWPPEPPQEEGPPRHQLQVIPPNGKGQPRRLEVTAVESSEATMAH